MGAQTYQSIMWYHNIFILMIGMGTLLHGLGLWVYLSLQNKQLSLGRRNPILTWDHLCNITKTKAFHQAFKHGISHHQS